jgi:RNA recognition motif-containing protein
MSRAVSIARGLPRPDSPVWSPSPAASLPSGGRGEERNLSKKLYVGNLSFSSTEGEIRAAFESHGGVDSVNVITDRETGRSRGFAFVEMEDASAAEAAVRALDGSDLGGRTLKVNEAKDRERRGGGGYGRDNRY